MGSVLNLALLARHYLQRKTTGHKKTLLGRNKLCVKYVLNGISPQWFTQDFSLRLPDIYLSPAKVLKQTKPSKNPIIFCNNGGVCEHFDMLTLNWGQPIGFQRHARNNDPPTFMQILNEHITQDRLWLCCFVFFPFTENVIINWCPCLVLNTNVQACDKVRVALCCRGVFFCLWLITDRSLR